MKLESQPQNERPEKRYRYMKNLDGVRVKMDDCVRLIIDRFFSGANIGLI